MAVNLFSERWYRIAAGVPVWRPGVRVDRQVVRGECWQLLSDATGERTVRLDPRAYAVVGRFDGHLSLEQIWQSVMGRLGDEAPTQDEVLDLLAALAREGLVDCPGIAGLGVAAVGEDERRRQAQRARRHPLMLRWTLHDPSAWLARCGPLAGRLFSVPAAGLALLLMMAAALVAVERLPELTRDVSRAFASPRAWLISLAVYVPMKAVHEAMHALALRRAGGLVHEAGIALMMFWPVPFVAAGGADRLASPGARALVSAAGILAELVMAAAGLLLWHLSEPGLIREIGLAMAVVGAVSTLLANGNPLVRLDGYHVLIDLLELPNLATRSARWWQERLLSRGLGLSLLTPLVVAPRERAWPWLYAPLALGYRLAIGFWLALWLGAHWAPAGWGLALWAVGSALLLPWARLMRAADQHSQGLKQRTASRLRGGLALAVLVLLLCGLPLPDRVMAEGVVWVPEGGQVRATDAGFVTALQVRDGQQVAAGQALLTLQDPELGLELERSQVRRAGLEVERYEALLRDPARAAQIGETLEILDEQTGRLTERLDGLQLEAPRAGRLSLPHASDLPGRHVARGERLGDVVDEGPPLVQVVLDQDEVSRLREGVAGVWVNHAWAPMRLMAARLEREVPAPIARLPSAALGRPAGGRIDTDPADREGLRPLEPTFTIDVRLVGAATDGARQFPLWRPDPGQRVAVRLDLGWSPLAIQGWRQLRRTFGARLAPDTV